MPTAAITSPRYMQQQYLNYRLPGLLGCHQSWERTQSYSGYSNSSPMSHPGKQSVSSSSTGRSEGKSLVRSFSLHDQISWSYPTYWTAWTHLVPGGSQYHQGLQIQLGGKSLLRGDFSVEADRIRAIFCALGFYGKCEGTISLMGQTKGQRGRHSGHGCADTVLE